ncbi:GNAT family N-acetyltransferase [Pseudomonas sp. BN415]|uniref:GNAT family N-acetyltransferase n=1 Tax=Pseudomonas sp. BN415 TaxID=2567889 RepID=UPI002454386D|nr:GNAT family N-acetyltransferase [Pseudomonas sp. BN415]MDH4584003.1 GNAT family N-acetyltransferase [Pseudomonas sp. BN415]
MAITWSCKHHSELDTHELCCFLALRCRVFVVEQNCPYLDVDGQDLEAGTCHVMAWEQGTLLAYLRLLDPATQGGDVVIGRVVSAAQARGRGLGHGLMERALDEAGKRWPGMPVYLSAQAHLQDYYGRYGFLPVTDLYLDDGIPHIGMRRA